MKKNLQCKLVFALITILTTDAVFRIAFFLVCYIPLLSYKHHINKQEMSSFKLQFVTDLQGLPRAVLSCRSSFSSGREMYVDSKKEERRK